MIAGASIKRLPYAAFFGYFLGGARKYRPRQGYEKKEKAVRIDRLLV